VACQRASNEHSLPGLPPTSQPSQSSESNITMLNWVTNLERFEAALVSPREAMAAAKSPVSVGLVRRRETLFWQRLPAPPRARSRG
jgi:hypothetical protein